MMPRLPYIPVLITGTVNSGKSTFIRALSEVEIIQRESQHPLPPPFNHPLEFGRRTLPDGSAHLMLFANVAAHPMPAMENLLAPPGDAYAGYVVMLDSSVSLDAIYSPYVALRKYLKDIRDRGRPYVIVANKRDHRKAQPLATVREELRLNDDEALIPCSTSTDRASVANVVQALVKQLPQDDLTRKTLAMLEALQTA